MNQSGRRTLEHTFTADEAGSVLELLHDKTGISKRKLKQAMQYGAVWLCKAGGRPSRIRKATAQARAGERVYLEWRRSFPGLATHRSC